MCGYETSRELGRDRFLVHKTREQKFSEGVQETAVVPGVQSDEDSFVIETAIGDQQVHMGIPLRRSEAIANETNDARSWGMPYGLRVS